LFDKKFVFLLYIQNIEVKGFEMVEFLLITLVISILAMMFGNGFGVVLGLVGLCLSIVLLLIYGLFAGFGVLFEGLYLLLTNLSLGGGIVLACLLVAVVLFVFLKKKEII